ncbi:MAG: DUF305 domain-containing protein, partial [Actinobacteria bacterium]|nr:DUF305 domain-containing protein [Actinomycetota bacterium]
TWWLQQWGAPTAMPGATDDDMAGMDHSGHDMGGMTMAGMMTAEQMQQLQDASGQQFDQMWMEMMIAHHEGAIEMAEQVQGSTNPQVADMADAIVSAQEAEITEMQVRAIIEAACDLAKSGKKVFPEIMIPLVGHVRELQLQERIVRRVADEVIGKSGLDIPYLVGTMIEIPRA